MALAEEVKRRSDEAELANERGWGEMCGEDDDALRLLLLMMEVSRVQALTLLFACERTNERAVRW